jgi:hypothetical protein
MRVPGSSHTNGCLWTAHSVGSSRKISLDLSSSCTASRNKHSQVGSPKYYVNFHVMSDCSLARDPSPLHTPTARCPENWRPNREPDCDEVCGGRQHLVAFYAEIRVP